MAAVSNFNQDDADTICAALAEGHSLLSICESMGIPYSTAKQWEHDWPEHAANSARAREIGCHALADQCLEIANTPMLGEERTIKPDGTVEIREADMLQHRRLQIDTRMRLLGKWLPKIYGDKVELSGDQQNPLTVVIRKLSE